MRSLTWSAVSTLRRARLASPSFSARRQFINQRIGLHTFPSDSSSTAPEDSHVNSNSLPPGSSGAAPDLPLKDERPAGAGIPEKPAKPVDKSNYGSASRRAGRNIKKPADIPPCHLPDSFIKKNVLIGIHERYDKARSYLESLNKESVKEAAQELPPTVDTICRKILLCNTFRDEYPSVSFEILLTVQAGLAPPASSYADAPFSAKPHLVLHCPVDGSLDFLDSLITNFASIFTADVINIDAQDIAEIGGRYLDEPGMPPNESLSCLSYELYASPDDENQSTLDSTGEEDIEVAEYKHDPRRPASLVKAFLMSNIANMVKGRVAPNTQEKHQDAGQPVMETDIKDSMWEMKAATFIDTLLRACDTSRAMNEKYRSNLEGTSTPIEKSPNKRDSSSEQGIIEAKSPPVVSPPVIVVVHDYHEICNTEIGGRIMDALHDALHERRVEGKKFLLIGTCTANDHRLAGSRPGGSSRLWDLETGPTTPILVPATEGMKERFTVQRADEIVAINIRHLQDMIRRLAGDPKQVSRIVSEFSGIFTGAASEQLRNHIWSADKVHRVASVAIGWMDIQKGNMSESDIENAIDITATSNFMKSEWLEESKKEQRRRKSDEEKSQVFSKKEMNSKLVQKKLRDQCNKHEKRLLHGVIDASSIRTTFSDIRAPKETIETLKTLTSLSLLRPDAFTYGVLATDKITGVLLYGPPGTGKTLLAKAVAKESGATVLEVSGADLNDMWVGEGEKNVKAIFTLAKKLTPCIVFIDEADAILASRGSSSNRVSHRELINQFLREWDGMSELSAFIMVATNRPFDLDEATLRRLPRRMLVDLPTEKDREEILKIHLQDEILDSEISLSKLAVDTPLYSGSDLKNLCVAAALTCVREEYDAANASSKATPVTDDLESSTAVSPQAPSTTSQTIPSTSQGDPLALAPEALAPTPPSLPFLSKDPSPKSRLGLPSKALAAISRTLSGFQEPFASVSNFLNSASKSHSPPASSRSTTRATSANPQPSIPPFHPITASPTPPTSSNPTKNLITPPKRILLPRHFARALEEISASVSDDMRSLTQIKKFDEKYGDRRGRRKKLGGGYGFGTLDIKEREKIEESGGRVRLGTPT
ncbi:MAG: hypothetical protein Q9182_003534 [Xanthomendoza sp. 2 TL-2023]